MRNILEAASNVGKFYGTSGGFHGFHGFEAFGRLSPIFPCHCTQSEKGILASFQGKASECGA